MNKLVYQNDPGTPVFKNLPVGACFNKASVLHPSEVLMKIETAYVNGTSVKANSVRLTDGAFFNHPVEAHVNPVNVEFHLIQLGNS
jgi:hypothetical protein